MYNTCKEFHIAFYEGLNQIASFQGQEYLEDEVDRFLTRSQDSVIDNHFNNALTNTKPYTDLEKIIEKNKLVTAYINDESTFGFKSYKIYKPYNLNYIINLKTEVKRINNCSTDTTITQTTDTEYVAVVPFDSTLFLNADYPIDCTITHDLAGTPQVIFNLSSYDLAEINSETEKFELIELIKEEINRKNIALSGNTIGVNPANKYSYLNALQLEVYWEYYKEYHYPNSLIFVSKANQANKFIEVKIDNSSATSYSGTTTNSTYYVIPSEKARGQYYSITNTKEDYTTPVDTKVCPCREIDHTKLYEYMSYNPHNKPKKDRPLYTQSKGYLFVYLPDNCTTSNVYLDYIREPKPFSLTLGWSSELGSSLHQNIVNRAVELAMAQTKDTSLEPKVKINQLER